MKKLAYVCAVVIALGGLSACAKRASTQAGAGAGAGGAAGGGLGAGADGTGGLGAGGAFSGSALDDPSSPLSKRRIHFEYDSYVVSAEYRPVVEAHAQYLAQNPGAAVTLEGHADERGSREYNIALGERRAEAVKQIMLALGAAPQQITSVSFGEEKPLQDCHEESCWWQNRRVEIIYTAR
jgi:peptidoglycan-associated lipoprotein